MKSKLIDKTTHLVPNADLRNMASTDEQDNVYHNRDNVGGPPSNLDRTPKPPPKKRTDGVKYTDEKNKDLECNIGRSRVSLRGARGTASAGDVKSGSAKGDPELVSDCGGVGKSITALDHKNIAFNSSNASSMGGLEGGRKRNSGRVLDGGLAGTGISPESEVNGAPGGIEGGSDRRPMVTFELQMSVCILVKLVLLVSIRSTARTTSVHYHFWIATSSTHIYYFSSFPVLLKFYCITHRT